MNKLFRSELVTVRSEATLPAIKDPAKIERKDALRVQHSYLMLAGYH